MLPSTYPWDEPLVLQPLAPAVFIGRQEGCYCPARNGRPAVLIPAVDLWNLTEDIPGHPANSTVSTEILLRAGFRIVRP